MHKSLPNVFTLEEGLDLIKLQTTGSVLHINDHLDEPEHLESSTSEQKNVDFIGHKLESFTELAEKMTDIGPEGLVKKKIIEEGGGLPLEGPCTVFIAYSGYFDNAEAPFDVRSSNKPLGVELTMTDNEDHGLIPGLDIAIKTMLVGELSIFLFSYKVAYGEYGIPPRIKPKAQCAFFVKLVKKILTPQNEKLSLSEPNMFHREEQEVKKMYGVGSVLYKSNNFSQAANIFNKAIMMLHKCRLADEAEENRQEKWLKKLYMNLALCYNKAKHPLKACTACNELNRLNSLWNNGRALFQNAKALRMIGQYQEAERKLKRAMKLCPKEYQQDELKAEMELLQKAQESANKTKLIGASITEKHIASDDFKREIDSLLENFKADPNVYQLTLPSGMGPSELQYLRKVCIRENLFIQSFDMPIETNEQNENENYKSEPTLAIHKEDHSTNGSNSKLSQSTHDS